MFPTAPVELPPEQTVQVMRVVESLEELDDVQQVYSTLKITDAAVAMLEAA
jgi:transcriptional/translational regulatory protein YebC/TACO1